ncbi:MAG: hypothetical protein Q4D93_03950 [Porphyromonas sp.]|nr:hypothetical protein [Porphyromonas sp.]
MKRPSNFLFRSFTTLLIASFLAFGITKLLAQHNLILGFQTKVFNPLEQFEPELPLEVSVEPTPQPLMAEVEEPAIEEPELVVEEVAVEEQIIAEQRELEAKVERLPGGLTDYSEGGQALAKWHQALSESSARSVRVAFLGDSFIEGDILVGVLRNSLQSRYGGKGVGYVPLTSKTARYRSTIKHRFSGKWVSRTSLHPKAGDRFTLAEKFDYTTGPAEASYEMSDGPSNLASVDRVTLLYQTDSLSSYFVSINGEEQQELFADHDESRPDRLFSQVLSQGDVTRVSIAFPEQFKGRLYGLYFDGDTGIAVDNYSLRGSSGLQLAQVSRMLTNQLSEVRSYDLIILSYGLNVASGELDDKDDYGWYYAGMKKSLQYLQELYPNAVFVIMSISDRATIDEGEVVSLPAVSKILMHQERLARNNDCLFWNTYEVMQEKGGIEGYVERRWAAKDYTHMSYAGGRELANELLEDLLP